MKWKKWFLRVPNRRLVTRDMAIQEMKNKIKYNMGVNNKSTTSNKTDQYKWDLTGTITNSNYLGNTLTTGGTTGYNHIVDMGNMQNPFDGSTWTTSTSSYPILNLKATGADYGTDLLCTIYSVTAPGVNAMTIKNNLQTRIFTDPADAPLILLKPTQLAASLSRYFNKETDKYDELFEVDQDMRKFEEDQTFLNSLSKALFESKRVKLFTANERKDLLEQVNEINKAVEMLSSEDVGNINIGLSLLMS